MNVDIDRQYAGEGFVVEHVVRGESVGEVLARANHHSPDMLCRYVRTSCSMCRRNVLVLPAVADLESCQQMLSLWAHPACDCPCSVKAAVDSAVLGGNLTAEAADRLMDTYNRRMRGYT